MMILFLGRIADIVDIWFINYAQIMIHFSEISNVSLILFKNFY